MTNPAPPPHEQPPHPGTGSHDGTRPHYPAQPDSQRLREGPPPPQFDKLALVAVLCPVLWVALPTSQAWAVGAVIALAGIVTGHVAWYRGRGQVTIPNGFMANTGALLSWVALLASVGFIAAERGLL